MVQASAGDEQLGDVRSGYVVCSEYGTHSSDRSECAIAGFKGPEAHGSLL